VEAERQVMDGHTALITVYLIWGLFIFSIFGGFSLVGGAILDWHKKRRYEQWHNKWFNHPKKKGNEKGAI